MNRKCQRFKYYYKISPILLVKRLVDKILAPIYRHEVGLMTLTEVPVNPVNKNNGETECIFLKTPASLKIWEKDISNLIPINELKEHLADDVGNIVIFATQPKSSGSGRKVIAYRKIQQIVFSDDWGIKGKLSADTLSIDYTEVLPEYRGQRVNRVLMDATQEYCRQNSRRSQLHQILLVLI